MSDEKYFVITSGEDGISIDAMTAEALKERLAEEYYGDTDGFCDDVPDIDNGCFVGDDENKIFVIKGKVVAPVPVEVVKSYEIP